MEKTERFKYDDGIVKMFLIATAVWGGVAFLLGLIAALQLANWKTNFGLEWITFGRLRPLHTNAAIFAYAGNAIFAGIYHSSQRLLKTRLFSDTLGRIHFWGWQLIIVSAALTLPLGITTGKEYAELEWPIDLAITLVWVVFAVNFLGTLFIRREKHIFVAIWFYIATIVTVAVLHIFNSLELPVSLFKSYSIYAGVQDALMQWWYGHNAVAFFLTTPFLGLMYYYIPKASGKPVYSYRLSIVHFWSLVFMYIWAGPHHLLYSSVPDWAQTLGMVFSVALLAPSWGGMINGLLTLRGAWDRVRREPVLKFFVAAVTFYGMATFEGPLMSIKSVNALSHNTDWTIGHVHGGALGWNGLMGFAILYFLVPKLWKTKLHSEKAAEAHFWLATVGILLYMVSMWASGITQGLMWRAVDASGRLVYPDFVETVMKIQPLYWIRFLGGLFFVVGYVLMAWNLIKTCQSAPKSVSDEEASVTRTGFDEHGLHVHRRLEGMPAVFTVLVLASIIGGTVIELVPFISAQFYVKLDQTPVPYTSLELAGRDIYIREGCYVCHTQMIRPMPGEVLRYGAPTKIEDTAWDHPFQWGSKRTGPDLARVGGKYPDLWHYRHMMDPRAVVNNSIMPLYEWLGKKKIDFDVLEKKVKAMRTLGVPYTDENLKIAVAAAKQDASRIAAGLKEQGAPEGLEDKEITALIAYLQRLGKNEGVPR